MTVPDIVLSRILIVSGALLGLIPFRMVENRKLISTYISFFGIWALILRCVILLMLVVVIPLILLAVCKLPCDYSQLSYIVFSVVLTCNLLLMFSTYLLSFTFIPRTLQLHNKFLDYDESYKVKCYYNSKQIIQKCILLVALLAEPMLNVHFILTRLGNIVKHGVRCKQYNLVDLSIPPAGLNVIFAFCVFLIHYPIFYTLSSIQFFSDMIQNRMCKTRQALVARLQRIPATIFYAKSLDVFNFDCAFQDVFDEIQELIEIFILFKNTVELLLVIFIGHATIVLTVFMYFARVSMPANDNHSAPIPFGQIIALLLYFGKITALTNCGQFLTDEVGDTNF